MKTIITSHNAKILSNSNKRTDTQPHTQKACNCRTSTDCPLQGKCRTETVVYKATIKTKKDTKIYIGSTENEFKQRYYAHKGDMGKQTNRYKTTLANHVWECKDKGDNPVVTWEILRKCNRYKCGTRRCDLCLTEKMLILRTKGPECLNKRSELMASCPHMRKYRLQNIKI